MFQPITFARKSLSGSEWWYSKIEWEALRIMHGLEKCHHYCSAHTVHVYTEPQRLVVIMGMNMEMIPWCLQQKILHIHQYRVHIRYKPGLKLYSADLLSCHNHKENKDREIWGLSINVNTIIPTTNLPMCTSIQDIQEATSQDAHLQDLNIYITHGWLHKKIMWHKTNRNIGPLDKSCFRIV